MQYHNDDEYYPEFEHDDFQEEAQYRSLNFATEAAAQTSFDEVNEADGLTPWQTSLNLVKATIGAGSMGLPFAFKQGGPVPFTFVVTLLMGALCAYTIVLLVQSERMLSSGSQEDGNSLLVKGSMDRDNASTTTTSIAPKKNLTLPEIGAAAFPGLNFSIFGVRFNAVEVLLHVIVQVIVLGVCVAYVDFIAQTLPSLFPDVFNAGKAILLVVPFFLCTAFLRSFSILAVTSIIGDVAVMAAFIAVVAYGFGDSHYGHLSFPMEPITHEVVGFIQTATFLFAVHANMLPIAQAMADPEKKFTPTLYTTFAFIVLVNATFGVLCYCLFDKDLASPVTLNLGCKPGSMQDGTCGEMEHTTGAVKVVVIGVQVLLCVDLLFTLPILLAAAREIIETAVIAMLPADATSAAAIEYWRNATRTVLVLLIALVSYLVPDFAIILKFLGGLFQSIIAFIIPPLVYNAAFKHTGRIPAWKYALHAAIVTFGVVMAVLSVVSLIVPL